MSDKQISIEGLGEKYKMTIEETKNGILKYTYKSTLFENGDFVFNAVIGSDEFITRSTAISLFTQRWLRRVNKS